MDEKIERLAELERQDIGYTHAPAAFFKIGFHRGFAAREHEVAEKDREIAMLRAALGFYANDAAWEYVQLPKPKDIPLWIMGPKVAKHALAQPIKEQER